MWRIAGTRCCLGSVVIGMLVAVLPLDAQQTATVEANPVAWATITARSGELLYFEVGRKQGVREGSTLVIVRGGETIGHLEAKYVASSRTSAVLIDSTTSPTVGDSLRYTPAIEAVAVEPPQPDQVRRARSTRRTPPVRGRLGLRYLTVTQANGTTLRQPALDLRLTGSRIGGSGLGLVVDIRAQRTSVASGTDGDPTPTSLTRVYQAAMQLQTADAGRRLAVGRQYATTLSPIGIFDGAALDLTGQRWSAGALIGTQPEAATFTPSGETSEFGLWLQRHNAAGSTARWTTTLGLVGSYHQGEINREFAYLRATYSTRRVSLYAAQEIDANRGWRREVEGSAATFTSSFATARLTLAEPLTVSAGIDSRRSVRLYRDFLNPEIVFDDANRQGHWGEVAVRVTPKIRMTTSARRSTGGTGGGTEAVTASLFANRLTALQLGVRLRATRYNGPTSAGSLASAMFEGTPLRSLRLSLTVGKRTNSRPGDPGSLTQLTWIGSDIDLAIGRSVYLMLSTYRESGTSSATVQNYGALSWRF